MRWMSFLLLGVFVGGESIAVAEGGATYQYVGWVEDETMSIQEPGSGSPQGWIKISNDAYLQAEFCELDSDYVCFVSPFYSYAVRKRFDPAVRKWTVRGIRFELVDEDLAVSIFGRRIAGIYLIKTIPGATVFGREIESPAYSLFSPEHGLVAFSIDREIRTYWLQGERGFGARQGVDAHPKEGPE